MSDIEKSRANRLQVMAAIHQKAGDNTTEFVSLWDIREALGLTDDAMANAVDYLEGERLIKPLRTGTGQRTPMSTEITHEGVVEMEKSEGQPDQPTEHFPPRNSVTTVYNIGNVSGSALQLGSPGAWQDADITVGQVAAEEADQVRLFLQEYAKRLPELQQEQDSQDLAEIAPRVNTVRKQIESPEPEKHIIKDSLASIKATLEHGVGGVVTVALLALLGQIHF